MTMLSFITHRLQSKLILAFVVVLLIPTIIIGVYAITTETSTLINVYKTDELGLVKSQADAVGLTVFRAKSALLFLAQSPVTEHYIEGLASSASGTTSDSGDQIPLFA